jgi:hypothetical protein
MDERIDLDALELDEARRELLVAAIMANAGTELERRQSVDISPMLVLSRWSRPALAAAAVIAVVCGAVLSLELTDTTPGYYGLTEELSVPEPADAWLVGQRAPTVGDVLAAMERGTR